MPDPVRPLLVRERAGRAEGHHQYEGPDPVSRKQDVLDDAQANGDQECAGPAGEPVEEVHDRVALARMHPVAGRQVDVDRLAMTAESGAGDVEPLCATRVTNVHRSFGGGKPR